MTDKKQRERALHDLNPIEDVKGAIEYVKHLHPVEELKGAIEAAVNVLEPSESDLRVVDVEEDTVSESPARESEDDERPAEAHPQPDAKALNKEHRGY